MSTTKPLMPESLKDGRYTLQEPIGNPGTSEVYLARDTHVMNRLVVVKLVRIAQDTLDENQNQRDALTNFDREVGILAINRHNCIVEIYDYGREEQGNDVLAYMVMPYCEEGSLQDWLRKYRVNNPLEVTEVAELLDQAGAALKHLHAREVVHRDIKSTNFLVGSLPDPSALPNLLLADFGFAQFVGVGMSQDDRGTYLYKAPEQWANARPVCATDQYQLAIMAYYLLTRKHPFEGSRDEVRNKHIYDRPPAPSNYRPDIPDGVDAVILRALATTPRDRYDTVKDFADAFREACGLEPAPGTGQRRNTEPQWVFRAIKTGSPRWVRPIAALIVALVIIAPTLAFNRVFFPPPTTNCNSNSALYPRSQSDNPTSDTDPFVNAPGIKDHMTDTNGNVIGLSVGATILDTTSGDNDKMQKGATALRNGNLASALAYFHAVTETDPSNAEAWIYAEDLRVLEDKLDYIAVVLGRDIRSERIGTSRESMQGAYLAQMAYNQSAPQRNCPSLVVIIASSGADSANTTWVAQRILELKKVNHHMVGVVGWSTSMTSVNANFILADELFMLAPSGASKSLEDKPYFLRIVPYDIDQAGYIADYAYNRLNYRKMAIMYDPGDIYSSDMFSSFESAFTKEKGSIVSEQSYTPGNESSLQTAFSNALQSDPDGIYLAGFSVDAGLVLSSPLIENLPSQFKILGNSAMASLNDYPVGQPNLDRLILVSYASQDEWRFLRVERVSEISTFSKSYERIFRVRSIGLTVMLTYDAVNVFLQGYQKALANGGTSTCLPCALKEALQSMNGAQAWQGVSGQIAFESGRAEPVDKVLLINVIENGATRTVDYRGCFLKGKTDCR